MGTALLASLALAPESMAQDGAASAADARTHAAGQRVVVSPRPGQQLRTHPVRIAVRADDGLRDLHVRLNGRDISREFGPRRRGLRRAQVAAGHGLRHATNVLRVRARQPDGRWRRSTVRFRIGHERPLAGAGFDRRAHVGQTVRLSGRSSRPSPRGAGRPRGLTGDARTAARRLRFRWRLVSAPRRSRLRPGRRARASGDGGGRSDARPLSGLSRPVANLVPDVPGTYTLDLTVTDGAGSSTDRVRVEAAPRRWLVPIDTMAGDGLQPGIKVGDTFYPATERGSENRFCVMQVLVLERKTLGLVANRSFADASSECSGDPDQPVGHPEFRISAFLRGFRDDKLVIASSHPSFTSPRFASRALAPIGMPQTGIGSVVSENDPSVGGTLSVIGVPGSAPGEAQVKVAHLVDSGGGELVGYLSPDQYGNFTWIPRERIHFDTRANPEGTPLDARQNTIAVGDERYHAELAPGDTGGYQVLILNRLTLRPRAPQQVFAASSLGRDAANNAAQMAGMASYIQRNALALDLVFVVSLGRPWNNTDHWEVVPPIGDMGAQIVALGGTRHAFVSSLLHGAWLKPPGAPYGLVGQKGASPAGGVGEEAPRVKGVLVPDEISAYRVRSASENADPANDAVMRKILEPPSSDWPLDDDPEAKRALAWLGSQIPQLGPDPRSAYVNSLDYDGLSASVQRLKHPGPGHGFCESVKAGDTCPALERARDQLVTELSWVANVRAYLKNLSEPFAETALSSFASLGKISDDIQRAASVQEDDRATALVLDIVEGALEIAAFAIPGGSAIGHALEVITETSAVVYGTVLEYWTQTREGESDDEVSVEAGKLGVEMAERYEDARRQFWTLGNVIVTDPAKLRFAGRVAGCNPVGNPDCPVEWSWSNEASAAASGTLLRGTEATFYTTLMPLTYPVYRVDPEAGGSNSSDRSSPQWPEIPWLYDYRCGAQRPFADTPKYGGTVLYAAEYARSPSHVSLLPYRGWVLGRKGASVGTIPAKPPAAILQRMFSPIDPGGDPHRGGLGIPLHEYLTKTPRWLYGANHCVWQR